MLNPKIARYLMLKGSRKLSPLNPFFNDSRGYSKKFWSTKLSSFIEFEKKFSKIFQNFSKKAFLESKKISLNPLVISDIYQVCARSVGFVILDSTMIFEEF